MNCEWVDGNDFEGLSKGDLVYALTDSRPFIFPIVACFNGDRLMGGYPDKDLPVKKWLKGVRHDD